MRRERREARLINQHPAGKNIGLDEVRAGRISVEQARVDRDELKCRLAAGNERARDCVEIGRPPALADGLDHLDRSKRVILLGNEAIVLQADGDPIGQSRLGNLCFSPTLLLCRQSQRGDDRAAPRRLDRQAPPAASDLEQAGAGRQVKPVEEQGNLVLLRCFQTLVRAMESRRRIAHRVVEPSRVEVIAEIVVRRDVVARLGQAVIAQAVGERIEHPHRPLRPCRVPQADRIGHEQFEQRHRVGRRPFARRPRLVPPDAARGRHPHQRHPAVDSYHRDRAGGVEADPAGTAVGQRCLDPATLKPCVELIDDAREQGRGKPAEPAATGDETTVRPHKMLTATGHRLRLS